MRNGSDTLEFILDNNAVLNAGTAADVEHILKTQYAFDLPHHTPNDFKQLSEAIQAYKQHTGAQGIVAGGGSALARDHGMAR